MKKLRFIAVLVLTVVLICTAAICSSAAGDKIKSFTAATASAESAADLGAVKWYLGRDDSYYLLLPSDADRSSLTVWFNATADVFCGEVQLENGKPTSVFAEGMDFTLTCGTAAYPVKVIQASATGAIYINTESGNMNAIHADKEHKESGTILILDKDGNVQYDGDLDYIKGRGNSTWQHDKKPYNIKLDSKADLFGMGKHKSWCLLANATDPTMLRNQLAYDLARKLGIMTTSESFQNELYVNGEYMGLYLITEKVDLGENRIEIYDLEGATEDVNDKDLDEYKRGGDYNTTKANTKKYVSIPNDPADITGGYLLELEKLYRYPDEISGFVTSRHQAVVVKTPEYASKNQVTYISGYYQEFENALYSQTGYNSLGKHYSEYIDVDSLARMYIMLEFTANFDSCSSSFYLYKDKGGKLVAGPCWDYDLSLGVTQPNSLINDVESVGDPTLLYAQTCRIGNHAKNSYSLIAQAFNHIDFQKTVEKIWREEFTVVYPDFRQNVDDFTNLYETSVVMNSVKWNTFGTDKVTSMSKYFRRNVEKITAYVDARFPFLSEAYAEDTYFVKYDIGKYGTSLKKDTTIYKEGDTVKLKSAPSSSSSSAKFIGWAHTVDGITTIYDAGETIVITDDTKLCAVWEKSSSIANVFKNFFESIKAFIEKIITIFSINGE